MIVTNANGEKQIVVQLGEHERSIVEQMCLLALENNLGNITQAAKSLGINRATLGMRLSKWETLRGIKAE